jgi:hypothetical protein
MAAMIAPKMGGIAARRFGRRYGNDLKIGNVDDSLGKFWIFANVPPIKDAMRIPVFRQIGKNENARDSLVSSAISALEISLIRTWTHIIDFKTAIFPFIIPFKLRVMMIAMNDLLSPKATAVTADPIQPWYKPNHA